MLIDEIKKMAKNNKVNVFFDMDGTLVEYISDSTSKRNQHGSCFYINNRPLKYIINIAKKDEKRRSTYFK